MIPKQFLEELAPQHHLSAIELETLWLAIEGNSIAAIATQVGSTPEAIRKRLGEVYKKFDIPGVGPGKLAKLQQQLVLQHQQAKEGKKLPILRSGNYNQNHQSIKPDPSAQIPSYGEFYGREEELQILQDWILEKRSRLVSVVGMGGIGKTSLAAKFAWEVYPQFDRVVWRSLHSCISAKSFLQQLIASISDHPPVITETNSERSISGEISELMHYLRQNRCLIVIDDGEAILSQGVAGKYQSEYTDYAELFQQVVEEIHQSTILFLSLEQPENISLLQSRNLPLQTLKLTGLPESDAKSILRAKGLSESPEWKTLIQLYRSNPLALKLISSKIKDFFAGDVPNFLSHQTLVFRDISNLIGEQFVRLSDGEKQLLYSLAILQKPVRLDELQQSMFPPLSLAELLDNLESLLKRSLIEKSSDRLNFSLQPVILEYITNEFVKQLIKEIQSSQIFLFNQHQLTPDNHILRKITNELSRRFATPNQTVSQLSALKTAFKIQENQPGYAIENLDLLIQQIHKNSP
jgi:hypothetical protein